MPSWANTMTVSVYKISKTNKRFFFSPSTWSSQVNNDKPIKVQFSLKLLTSMKTRASTFVTSQKFECLLRRSLMKNDDGWRSILRRRLTIVFFRQPHLYLLPFEATSSCFSFPILTPLPQANKRLLADTFIILNVLDFFVGEISFCKTLQIARCESTAKEVSLEW